MLVSGKVTTKKKSICHLERDQDSKGTQSLSVQSFFNGYWLVFGGVAPLKNTCAFVYLGEPGDLFQGPFAVKKLRGDALYLYNCSIFFSMEKWVKND